MTARKATKCSECGDIIYFRVEDVSPQSVICPCGATKLNEGGPVGSFEAVPDADLESLE